MNWGACKATAKFTLLSALGVVAFFVPLDIAGRSTILIDHLVTGVASNAPTSAVVYTVVLIAWGVIDPFRNRTWNSSRTQIVLSVLQCLAIPLVIMQLSGVGPAAIMAPDMLPFLFDKLAVPVGLVVPIGAIFLTFLIGFGLLEAIGTLMEPVMRPLFRTPGRSAIDAMASFAGSYSVGLLITSRIYKSGQYTAQEAAVIATGFSTVSATFMVIVAKTLQLSEYWNAFFFGAMLVTFVVTAITVRLPPLANFEPLAQSPASTQPTERSGVRAAWAAGVQAAGSAASLRQLLRENVVDGLLMATRVVPSILAMGLLGLLAARYTPLFDAIGLLFAPVVWLLQPDNAVDTAAIIASGLAEMFLPAVQATGLDLGIRFVIGIVSISSILFLSASIPCILATGIPLSMWQLLLVWVQRTLVSIPLAWAAGHLFGVM
ncbi:MAG TPA: YjiH family protein [Woeseiaceae bacterium]